MMNLSRNILLCFIALFWSLTSCVNTKKYSEIRIHKNQLYYSLTSETSGDTDTVIYTVKKSMSNHKSKIKIEENKVQLTPTDKKVELKIYKIVKDELTDSIFNQLLTIAGSPGQLDVFPSPLEYFECAKDLKKLENPINELDFKSLNKTENKYQTSEKLRYNEGQPIFQAMTIPFKYRPALNDTIPSQITTSFNIGFAVGYKYSHRSFAQRYKGSELLNSTNPSYSITPGFFIGPTLISLKNGESVKEPIGLNRTTAGITTGIFIVGGVNKFNIGLAFGFDQALGEDSEKWIYQKDPFWWGFVLAFDFVK